MRGRATTIVLSDNDVRGAVTAFRHILQSPDWLELSTSLELQFMKLEDVGLSAASSDREIWIKCQEIGALLITCDRSRADGSESLHQVIQELNTPTSIPVATIGDQLRPTHDRDYAMSCAVNLLALVLDIEHHKGIGIFYL